MTEARNVCPILVGRALGNGLAVHKAPKEMLRYIGSEDDVG
jgi:hypothetical protein